jgi:hypothetical protein
MSDVLDAKNNKNNNSNIPFEKFPYSYIEIHLHRIGQYVCACVFVFFWQ